MPLILKFRELNTNVGEMSEGNVQIPERRTHCITDADRGVWCHSCQPTHGDAHAACSLYVYSHCSCRESCTIVGRTSKC